MRARSIVGPIILICVGVVFLLSNLGWIPNLGQLLRTWWPLILIVVGVSMLLERGWCVRQADRGTPIGRHDDV